MTMVNIHICNLRLKMVVDLEAFDSDTISQNKVDVTWGKKTFTIVHSTAFMHTHVHVATHIYACTRTHLDIQTHLDS